MQHVDGEGEMSETKIKVIVKRPDERAGHVTYMSNTLRAFQKAVGGNIETVSICKGVTMVVNEEGKILDLDANFAFGSFGFWRDLIQGTAVIVGVNGDEFTDLPEGFDMAFWKELLRKWDNAV